LSGAAQNGPAAYSSSPADAVFLSVGAIGRFRFSRPRGQPCGQPILPNGGAQPGCCVHDVLPFGMRVDRVDFGRLLAEQFHHFIIFGSQLPVVRRVTVPEDLMRHAL